jgi:hypothetical protein
LTQGTYSETKHKWSDLWLHSTALNRHVQQAFSQRLRAFNLSLDSALALSTTSFDHDAHFCIDCEFTAADDDDKEIRLTGRTAFRCRTPGNLRWGDVTISRGFVDGRPAEYYKTRATKMIYAHENSDTKVDEKGKTVPAGPDNGFPLVLIFDLSHTIDLIEIGVLPAELRAKKHNGAPYEEFYGVKILDLYKHHLLWYVGVCPTQRTEIVASELRGVFKKDMPDIWEALEGTRSYWSALPSPNA